MRRCSATSKGGGCWKWSRAVTANRGGPAWRACADRVRLRLQRGQGEERRGKLYRLRYGLLRDPKDWTERERQGLEELFVQLPQLKRAWELREAFRAWDEAVDRGAAEDALA